MTRNINSIEDACAQTRSNRIVYRLSRLFRLRHLTIDGFKVIGYRTDVPKHVSSLLARGDYEAPERLALQRFLRTEDRVVEIGTCVGIVALTAARIVGARNIVTFEPNPDAAAIARENFALNGQEVALHNAAVGERAGTLNLSIGPDSWLGASAVRNNHGTTRSVPVIAIADVIQNFRPTVLVMDVEGMESGIVPATPLQGLRAVMIEFHPDTIGDEGVERIRVHLRNNGFQSRGDLNAAATEVWERSEDVDATGGATIAQKIGIPV